MQNYLESKRIPIGGIQKHVFEYNSSYIFIYSGTDVISPRILSLQIEFQSLICAMEWLAIAIGCYLKGIMYKGLYEKWKRMESTEIDSLIFANALIQNIGIIVYEVRKTLIIVNGESLEYVTSHLFCSLTFVIMEFEFLYSVIGSLGISLYRIILVKANQWAKNKIGVQVLRNSIFCGGIIITLFLVTLMNIKSADGITGEHCAYFKDTAILEMIDNYKQTLGETTASSTWHFTRTTIGMVLATMTFTEIILYIILFRFIYRHDNAETLKRLLDPTVIQQRNRRNLVSFVGQFCVFITKLALALIFMSAVILGNRQNGIWMISLMIKTISFSVLSLVEVLMSASLRQRLCGNILI